MKNSLLYSDVQIEGDLRIGDENHVTYVYEGNSTKSFFEEIKVDISLISGYIKPKFLNQLKKRVSSDRLQVLGGGYHFNKDGLLKFLAMQIAWEFQNVLVKECLGLNNLSSLLTELRKSEQPTVFLLFKIVPEVLEFHFSEIRRVAGLGNHYVLITTDTSRASWHLDDFNLSDIWFEIPDSGFYEEHDLVREIKSKLEDYSIDLPVFFDTKHLANLLQTPENINIFINLLTKQPEVSQESIQHCLKYVVSSDVTAISQWFQKLDNDKKLLTIGFSLLSGLKESQFFDAMDILINDAWAGRNHSLKSLDYEDIIPLLTHFRVENSYIDSRYPDQNKKLLDLAWKSHRRFIDAAMPVLVRIAMSSTDRRVSNWRLYGSEQQRRLLRQVITKALVNLGEINFSTVETPLLSLGAHPNIEVRLISAEILASLRPTLGDHWYKVISQWQNSVDMYNVFIDEESTFTQAENSETNNRKDSINLVRATIALTLGAVATKDNIDELDSRVIEQMLRLAKIKNELVTKGVQHSLRIITSRHALQVEGYLNKDFLKYSTFIEPIAAGLADAYNSTGRDAVRAVISQWLDEINRFPANRYNHTDFLHEDKILCCIIRTFELLDYSIEGSGNQITIEEAHQMLDFLRTISHQPQTRKYLLDAIISLIEKKQADPDQQTINHISNLDPDERDMLVNSFKTQYLSQRALQSGGEYRVKMFSIEFPGWKNSYTRPRTKIELLMKEWLDHPEKTISQIATLTFLEFGKIEDIERQKIEDYIQEIRRVEALQEANTLETPEYNSAIEATPFTQIFIKVASQVVLPIHVQKITNISPILLQTTDVSDAQLANLLSNFDDINSEQDTIVSQLVFLYNLFQGRDIDLRHNPFRGDFWVRSLRNSKLTIQQNQLLLAWGPILIQNIQVSDNEVDLILYNLGKWAQGMRSTIMWFRFFYRNPWIWIILLLAVLGLMIL